MLIKLFVVVMYLLSKVFDTIIDCLRDAAAKRELPGCVRDVYDEKEYRRWLAYHTDKRRLKKWASVTSTVITVVLLLTNVYAAVFRVLPGGTVVRYLLFSLIFEAFSAAVEAPFDFYATFTVEERYGMNKSTRKTFIGDTVKEFILNYVIAALIMFLVLFAFEKFGNFGILIACGGVSALLIVVQLCSGLLLRLFNKFTPLEEGKLRDSLTELCAKYGTTVKEINVMDMSRRTTKANAFCSGLGKTKMIALADNLVERYTEDQIVGVFAHEFGHAKYKHMPKLVIGNIISLCTTIVLFGVLLNFPQLFTCFGFDDINYYFLFTIALITWPVNTLVSIVDNCFSRKYEYQADSMAAKEGYGEDIISALKQLSKESLSDLNPHPAVVVLEYSHPTLAQRIEAIRSISGEKAAKKR